MNNYWIIIPLIICLYVIVIGFVYLIQDYFIFKPIKLDQKHDFEFNVEFKEYFLPTEDNYSINVIHFKSELMSKGLIIYFHGNADHLQRWGLYAQDFTSKGYDVLMMDYRGYGKTKGECSEVLMKKDAEMIYHWANENLTYTHLIFYGRSLGTGIASYMGTCYPSDLVVLETPFYSIRDIFEEKGGIFKFPIEFKNSFQNYRYISSIASPIVIFHGTDDKIVPYSSAIKLKNLLKTKDTFYTIEGGMHTDLNEYSLFHNRLSYHLNKLD